MSSPSFRLAECEAVITQGIRSFYETGKALQEIRDQRLYKETGHSSFEEYCLNKWKFTKDYANKLVASYSVIKELEASQGENNEKPNTIVSTLPTHETQVRPLTKIKDPEERLKAWNEVVEKAKEAEKPITAKDVEAVASKYCTEPKDYSSAEVRIVGYLNIKYKKLFDEYLKEHDIHESQAVREFVEYGLNNRASKIAG